MLSALSTTTLNPYLRHSLPYSGGKIFCQQRQLITGNSPSAFRRHFRQLLGTMCRHMKAGNTEAYPTATAAAAIGLRGVSPRCPLQLRQ